MSTSGRLVVAAAVVAAGCTSMLEVPVDTPLQSKLDVSGFRRILIAGFVTDLEDSDVDLSAETSRLLQNQLRSNTQLQVLEPDRPPLQSALETALEKIGEGGSYSSDEKVQFRLEADRLLQDPEFWRKMGEEYQQPLIVAGKLDFESQNRSGFQPDERVVRDRSTGQPSLVRSSRFMERKGYVLSADFYFIDSKTGELLHKERFSEEVLYAEDQRISPLSSYFELMDRLLPNFLGVLTPAEDPRDAGAAPLEERPCCDDSARSLLPALSLALAAAPASAQFVPYYGKNKVKYDNFSWRIYKSPHFEVYYYPEFEQHLARLTSYLESGYLKISTGLKHEMPKAIPVIFYKTHSEFEQTNLFPAFVPEGVAAFTEPLRNRMVIPIDEPPDQLQGLITHELTHVFAFDLIPRGLGYGISQQAIPLWVDEGLADYFRGIWDPLDLMMVRDAALTDQVPRLSRVRVRGALRAARLQHRPRRVRVHRGALRQGGHPAVPVHAAQGAARRRARGALQAGVPHDAGGVRRGLRQVAEGALQAVPRPPAARRLRARPLAQPGEDQLHPGLRLRAEPLGRDRGGHDRATARTARPTWC